MNKQRPLHNFLFLLLAALLIGNTAWTDVAGAASNSVLGGLGGVNNGTMDGGDGTGSAQITITSDQLDLVKQARDLTGTVINGGDVSSGQEVYFVIYVDNSTLHPAVDIRITDLLDEAEFTYVDDSIEYTTVATGSDDAAIWAGTWNGRTDNVGGPDDQASCTDFGAPAGKDRLTIGQVTGQANLQLDIAGSTLWALRIRVTIK